MLKAQMFDERSETATALNSIIRGLLAKGSFSRAGNGCIKALTACSSSTTILNRARYILKAVQHLAPIYVKG